MPTYTFYNKDTDEQFDEFMSWSEREKYLKDNPHIEPMLTTAALVGDHIVNKMDGGTAASSITPADTDRVVYNDNGTNYWWWLHIN